MGLDRDLGTLKRLQESIFQTDIPTEPTQGLGSWVYLSGAFYSMHDIARESVQFSQDILLRIMNYFRDNHEIIQGDETTLYQSGNFIGKNISYLLSEKDPMLLPHKLYFNTKRRKDEFRTSSIASRDAERKSQFRYVTNQAVDIPTAEEDGSESAGGTDEGSDEGSESDGDTDEGSESDEGSDE